MLSVEAYLSKDGYDTALFCNSDDEPIQQGVSRLTGAISCRHDEQATTFRWAIPDDRSTLVLSLTRKDKTLLDRIKLRLSGSEGSAGLVVSPPTRIGCTGCAFFDFEQGPDLTGWEGNVDRSSEYAFTGENSLQITLEEVEDGYFARGYLDQPFEADWLVVHHFLPSRDDFEIDFVEFCMPESNVRCQELDESTNAWHTTLIDLSAMRGQFPDSQQLPGLILHIKGHALGAAEPSYSMYVDTIEIIGDNNR
jgi:hypothetical protein